MDERFKITEQKKLLLVKMRSNGAPISMIRKALGFRSDRMTHYWMRKLCSDYKRLPGNQAKSLTPEQVQKIRDCIPIDVVLNRRTVRRIKTGLLHKTVPNPGNKTSEGSK